jgi:hypothetical protein
MSGKPLEGKKEMALRYESFTVVDPCKWRRCHEKKVCDPKESDDLKAFGARSSSVKSSVRTSKKTHGVYTTTISWLMLFNEIIAVLRIIRSQ